MKENEIKDVNWTSIIILISTNLIFSCPFLGIIIVSLFSFELFPFLALLLVSIPVIFILNYVQLQIYGRSTPRKMILMKDRVEVNFLSLFNGKKIINVSKVKTIDISRMMLSTRYNAAFIYPSKILFLHNLSRKGVKKLERQWPKKIIKSKPIFSWQMGILYKNTIYKKYRIDQKTDHTW